MVNSLLAQLSGLHSGSIASVACHENGLVQAREQGFTSQRIPGGVCCRFGGFASKPLLFRPCRLNPGLLSLLLRVKCCPLRLRLR